MAEELFEGDETLLEDFEVARRFSDVLKNSRLSPSNLACAGVRASAEFATVRGVRLFLVRL